MVRYMLRDAISAPLGLNLLGRECPVLPSDGPRTGGATGPTDATAFGITQAGDHPVMLGLAETILHDGLCHVCGDRVHGGFLLLASTTIVSNDRRIGIGIGYPSFDAFSLCWESEAVARNQY